MLGLFEELRVQDTAQDFLNGAANNGGYADVRPGIYQMDREQAVVTDEQGQHHAMTIAEFVAGAALWTSEETSTPDLILDIGNVCHAIGRLTERTDLYPIQREMAA